MIKLLFKFVLAVMALGVVIILVVYFLPSVNLTNSKQIINEPFFTKVMIDTHDLADINLNPYCIKDLIDSEEGEINYKACLEKHKEKDVKFKILNNFDGPTENISTEISIEENTWYIDLADFVGNRSTGEGMYYYEVTINGGGSGAFSSIKTIALKDDMLTWISNIEGGDRCNDGNIDYINFNKEKASISYVKAATPFRLLNYKDKTDWRQMSLIRALTGETDSDLTLEEFGESQGATGFYDDLVRHKDIDDCAMCCVGHTVNEFNVISEEVAPVGVTIYKVHVTERFREGCFFDWLAEEDFKQYKSYSENDELIYLDQQDWAKALKRFSRKCS
jgi:hypothetical protein